MRMWKPLTVAALLSAPLVLAAGSANALTARQQAALGQGVYLTSKGVPQNYGHSRVYGDSRVYYGEPGGWRRRQMWRDQQRFEDEGDDD